MIDTLINYTTQDWFPLAAAMITKAPRLVRVLARLVRRKAKTRSERRAVDPEKKE